MVALEAATPAAAQAVLGLMEPFYAEQRYPFDRQKARAALERFLADPALGRAWLLKDGEAAVGYFVLTLGFSLEYGGRDAFVDELFVLPSHRGRGLGYPGVAGLLDLAHHQEADCKTFLTKTFPRKVPAASRAPLQEGSSAGKSSLSSITTSCQACGATRSPAR